MTEALDKLNGILGEERLKEITRQLQTSSDSPVCFMNAKEIACECNTVILKPNQATLIVPSQSMLEIEKNLMFLQANDSTFKNLVRGCYWMVDDMYKFEQMGYTKEVDISSHRTTTQKGDQAAPETSAESSQSQPSHQHSGNKALSVVPTGLRYLACAECNLCPLGWFDSETKESYLYVW